MLLRYRAAAGIFVVRLPLRSESLETHEVGSAGADIGLQGRTRQEWNEISKSDDAYTKYIGTAACIVHSDGQLCVRFNLSLVLLARGRPPVTYPCLDRRDKGSGRRCSRCLYAILYQRSRENVDEAVTSADRWQESFEIGSS